MWNAMKNRFDQWSKLSHVKCRLVSYQEFLAEETRKKLFLSNKLQESQVEIKRLKDQLGNEKDAKLSLQQNLSRVQKQVSEDKGTVLTVDCNTSQDTGKKI